MQRRSNLARFALSDLQRAVELNAKLVPHVLQFVDFHFRGFFETPSVDQSADDLDTDFSINYDRLVTVKDDQLELKDNLGCLVQFVAHCLAIFERGPFGCDVREMQRLLTLCTQRLVANRLSLEDIVSICNCLLLFLFINILILPRLRQLHL